MRLRLCANIDLKHSLISEKNVYLLNIYLVTKNEVGGINGYEDFEFALVPKVGQWLLLLDDSRDESEKEQIYEVIKVSLPLHHGGTVVEIYVTHLGDRHLAESALSHQCPTLLDF